jgi:hypothetical protein
MYIKATRKILALAAVALASIAVSAVPSTAAHGAPVGTGTVAQELVHPPDENVRVTFVFRLTAGFTQCAVPGVGR